MSTLSLISAAIFMFFPALELALFFGRGKDNSKFPPGSGGTKPGHKPPPTLWFQAMAAMFFILNVFYILSIMDTLVTPRPMFIGSMGIVAATYQISLQKVYGAAKLTTVLCVVCSAFQFLHHIPQLHSSELHSSELLATDIKFFLVTVVVEYTCIFWVYVNVPESTPRVNKFVRLGQVFSAITIITALVLYLLHRWGIVDSELIVLIVTYTMLLPIFCGLLYKLWVALERKQHRVIPSLPSSVVGSNVTLTELGTQSSKPTVWPTSGFGGFGGFSPRATTSNDTHTLSV